MFVPHVNFGETKYVFCFQMKNYYGTNDYQTKLEGDVKLNRVYAAKVDDEWQRVKVFNIDGQLVGAKTFDTFRMNPPFLFLTEQLIIRLD